jgi:phosphoribosylformylglycinamidine synthase I
MNAAVIVFPGSNCDHDCYRVLQDVMKMDTQFIWHKERTLPKSDLVVLPGGFSYGDYLRSGAIARFSPIMEAVTAHASRGGYTLGICNGFQILTEAGLLPGALLPNRSLNFVCQDVSLRVETHRAALTSTTKQGDTLTIPVAHGDGCYFNDADGIKRLEDEDQVLFRYVEEDGSVADTATINGSISAIAGVMNANRNIFGMMPHPERCAEALIGGPAHRGQNTDGRKLFEGLLGAIGGVS